MILLVITTILLPALLLGWLGHTRKIGFWIPFVLSILLTLFCFYINGERQIANEPPLMNTFLLISLGPIVTLIIVLLFKSKAKDKYEKDILTSLQNNSGKLNNTVILQELEKLSKLLEQGHITKLEYEKLKKKLMAKYE